MVDRWTWADLFRDYLGIFQVVVVRGVSVGAGEPERKESLTDRALEGKIVRIVRKKAGEV